MPTLSMLVGVPGSGKSTWIQNQKFNNTVIISSDDIIEKIAKEQGKTYSEVFKTEIKNATAQMNLELQAAISSNKDIIWDQTNINKNTRRSKLLSIPNAYKKIAVVFPIPSPTELARRLGSRPGKTIPPQIIDQMITGFEKPDHSEGFDDIIFI